MALLQATDYMKKVKEQKGFGDTSETDVYDAFACHNQLIGNVPLGFGARMVINHLEDC